MPEFFVVAEHASQRPVQAVAQQTLSTQNVDAHCVAPVHGCATVRRQLPFASHVSLPVQLSGSVPFVTAVQVPGVVRSHAWHVPQLADSQQTPSTQLPVSHCVPAVHAPPWVA